MLRDPRYPGAGAAGLLAAIGCAATMGAATVAGAQDASHPAPRVVIDGAMGDWRSPAQAIRRTSTAADTTPGSADVIGFATQQDGREVYFRIDFARPTTLYGLTGTVSIAIDADGNAETGDTVDSLAGVDFTLEFSPSDSSGRVASGAALRLARRGGSRLVDTYPLDFVLLPTYASTQVEMRLTRGARLDSVLSPVFAGTRYRARLSVRDSSGAVRYALPVLTAQLQPIDRRAAAVPTHDPLARATGTQFRALVWNVANEGLLQRPAYFRRILRAIDPDLLVLNEVGGILGAAGVERFLASVDSSGSRAPWHFTYGQGGGYQRTVIASRTTVDEFPEFVRMPFPDSVSERLLALVPPATRPKQRASLADGVATGGAIVTLAGRRVAVFGVDLQSAGNPATSWQEARRRAEATLIRNAASAALRQHGPVDGVIVAGDHNLVSTREPLTLLGETGLAFDHRALRPADLLELDGSTAATWDGRSGPFPPGRLDWFSFSASTLTILHGFIFDVADVAPRWRAVHGLEADDSRLSSDHRPLVLDLRWAGPARH